MFAYQVIGDGPLDVVLIPAWFSNVEAIWDLAPAARFIERIASFSRAVIFDRRGTGLSDPVPVLGQPFFEQSTDDLIAVLDAVGSTGAALVGCDGGGPVAMLAAGTHPARFTDLVLVNTFARLARAEDYPAGVPMGVLDTWLADSTEQWKGEPAFGLNAPSAIGDPAGRPVHPVPAARGQPRRRLRHPEGVARPRRPRRAGVDPGADPRHPPPGDRMVRVEHGRYLARHIPGARLAELPGGDDLFYLGDTRRCRRRDRGVRDRRAPRRGRPGYWRPCCSPTSSARPSRRPGRRPPLARPARRARPGGGALVSGATDADQVTGDGVLATFDGPARAIRVRGGHP